MLKLADGSRRYAAALRDREVASHRSGSGHQLPHPCLRLIFYRQTGADAPDYILISVIGSYFMSGQPVNLAAVGLTELVATRLSFLPTVFIGVVSAGLLRYLCPWPLGLSR